MRGPGERIGATASILQLEERRTALTGHCYRMLGSVCDAEDATQETMIRAWRHLDSFDGRASLRTWLYRIATNVCLDQLSARNRRWRPMEEGSGWSRMPGVADLAQEAGNIGLSQSPMCVRFPRMPILPNAQC